MQRIHAPFVEPTLEQIDREVKKSGVSGLVRRWIRDHQAEGP